MDPNVRPSLGQRTASASLVRPGSMTNVMRALTASAGPRIPRIAILRGGRIMDERLFKQPGPVTIGASEDASFTVAAPFARHVLFERVAPTAFKLHLAKGMTARLASAAGISEVQGPSTFTLDERARGKIVFGDSTFLFELVAAPPPQARPELPLTVKDGVAGRVDWNLAIIAAVSFLFHFGIVGAMYSDWMDPTIGPERDVVGLVDMMKNLPNPQPEYKDPLPAPPDDKVVKNDKVEDKSDKTKKADKNDGPVRPSPHPPSPVNDRTMSDAKAAALAKQANDIEVAILAAKNAPSAVEGTLRRSEIPAVDLDSAAKSAAAAKHGDNGLKVAPGGDPVQATNRDGLTKIAKTGRDGKDDAGKVAKDPLPPLIVENQQPIATAAISDADRVIAGLRSRFRKCYETGMAGDPTMQGKVIIAARIQPNGEVQSASVESNEGLSSGVAQCIAGTVKNATFTGNGSMTTLKVPVTFRHQ